MSGWREAGPEIVIAVLAAAALGGAAYAFAGTATAVLTLTGAGAVVLAGLRGLTPPDDVAPPPHQEALTGRGQTTTFAQFWRRHSAVQDATRSMAAYDFQLRGTLQHLLAARLAERHGISLYDEPEAARRLLARGGSDRLWYWLDPGREAVTDQDRKAGIPPRTLAAIIDRLEHL